MAEERGFQVLPFGAEIDRFQRSPAAELLNALFVGFVCLIFTLQRLPGTSQQTHVLLADIDDIVNWLFFVDYIARWWSRGLRFDYLLTPSMFFDFISIVPFLLRGLAQIPGLAALDLSFLKLLRVLRIYRLFRPGAFRWVVRFLLPFDRTETADQLAQEIRPYQLQVIQTGGVLFTLIFITAGLIYEAEHGVNPEFPDLPSAIYFSIVALSTVGFGDFAPVTPAGRSITSVCIILGLCIIPFQASLVASAFAEEERLKEAREAAGRAADTDAILSSLAETRAQLAWDAARIAELEDLEREERYLLEKELKRREIQAEVKAQG